MNWDEATTQITDAKRAKGRTFADVAADVGVDPVYLASVFHGQASMTPDAADALARTLELGPEVADQLTVPPTKDGLGQAVPTDPLIYRFHEIMQVYGTALKDVIHEEFGDGIMSAIDFEMTVARREDPAGDRVVVTMDGKFLPYRKW